MSNEDIKSLEPLQPLFDFSAAPGPVTLFHGELKLCWENASQRAEAAVILNLAPKPHLAIEAKLFNLSATMANLLINDLSGITYSLDGQEIEGFVKYLGFGLDGDKKLCITPSCEPLQIVGDVQAKATVSSVFHLFNFPDFIGKRKSTIPLPAGYRHIVLQDDNWQVIIQSLIETTEATDNYKKNGGYFLTHVGELSRTDGASFSGDEASEQYHLVASFLSFLQGSRCRPICAVGFDKNGSRSWETWASPPASIPAQSWFDPHHSAQAEALFPLFSKYWKGSEPSKDCLRSAIYWYIQSNTSGGVPSIDAAIILAQSALERLAHHYLVVDRGMISSEGFRKLRVSDQLRLFFSSLHIPTAISGDIPEIKKAGVYLHWKDAPHALTEVRNSLVHPENKNKERIRNCYVEAWRLSLWYVELSVLALCDYGGTYGNRLTKSWVGEVEDVPWKAKGGLK